MDLPSVAADPRFASFEARRQNRTALVAILSEEFPRRPTADWMRLLRGRVPVAPVRSMEAALDATELAHRAMLAAYHHPILGEVKTMGLPIKMDGFTPVYRPAPSLDGDRDVVLAAAGYGAVEIDDLRNRGAFGHG